MKVSPMLAKQAKDTKPLLESKKWIIEPKYDGIRAVAYINGTEYKLINRSGIDVTTRFPELTFPNIHAVVDGEIYCLQDLVPNFQLMQTRMNRISNIKEYSESTPATFTAFDLLELDGKDLTGATLMERKGLLENLPLNVAPTSIATTNLHDLLLKQGWEGVMAKHVNSRYLQGRRSNLWLKIKFKHQAVVSIVGVTVGVGKRTHTFGSLVMAVGNKELHFCGNLGTGFTDEETYKLYDTLSKLKTETCPLNTPVLLPILFWTQPKVKVLVEYLELSNAGMLRHPAYIGVVDGM